MLSKDKLPVLEEFVSVQGEGRNLGMPYYFIRVGGCPLRCNFCDSEYTWTVDPTSIMSVDAVIDRAWKQCATHNIRWISITGGEPLLYPEQLKDMMLAWRKLSNGELKYHIETSGRFHDEHVHGMSDIYSVDAKTPCTGETMKGFFKGMQHIRECDQVKCLINGEVDLDYAYQVNQALDGRCAMVLQPFNTEIGVDDSTIASLRRSLCSGYNWLLKT